MTFLHNTLYQITPNSDGSIDTRFKNGSKPGSGTPLIVLDQIAFATLMAGFNNMNSGDVVQRDLVATISGPGISKATFNIISLSGDDAVASGWVFSGTKLTATAGAAHAGVLDVTVTDEVGQVYNFPSTQWVFNAAAGSDTMAPTVPLGVSLINASGGYTVFADQATDGFDGTNSPTGVKEYRVYNNATNAKLATITAPTANKGGKLALNTVGSPTGTNTATQNKKTWTLVADGLGVYAVTADECVFEAVQLTGDQAVSVQLAKYTSAYQYSMAGIMIRESAAPNAVAVMIYLHPNNNGIRGAVKTTTGGSSGNSAQVLNIDGPIDFSVERAGDVWTLLFSSNGGTWQVLGTINQSMSTSPLWGMFACSRNPGNPITAVFTDFNVFRKPTLSQFVAAAANQTIYLTSVDVAGNESLHSSVLSYTAPASGGTGAAVKVIKGSMLWGDNQYPQGAEGQLLLSGFNATKNNSLIHGVFVSSVWAQMEGAQGDYTQVYALIDKWCDPTTGLLSTANHPMGMILSLWASIFNKTSAGPSDFPAYAIANGWIKVTNAQGQGRVQPDWDNDAVWTALTTMFKAIMNRYNGNKYFAALALGDETDMVSVEGTTGHTILNSSHYNTKLLQFNLDVKSVAPNTLVYVPFNYLPPGDATVPATMANMINTLEAAYPNGFLYGGPDPFLRQTTFQKLVAGVYQSTSGMGDVRSKLLIQNRVQGVQLGNRTDSSGNPIKPGNTVLDIYDSGLSNNCVTFVWNLENYMYYKWTDQLAAITTRAGQTGTPPPTGNYTII